MQAPGTLAMRRGGARQQVSERVVFRRGEAALFEGWALNVSRGGLRAILDTAEEGEGAAGPASPELGDEYEVCVGDPETASAKRGRIVWLQEEPDGFVVGVEYAGDSVEGPRVEEPRVEEAGGEGSSISGTAPSAAPARDSGGTPKED
jgi:hypothetical protein